MALDGSQEHHQSQGIVAPGGRVAGINIGSGFAPFPLPVIPRPLEFVNSPFANKPVNIDHHCKVPYGWQRCLDLKNGKIFFKDLLTGDDDVADMSRCGKTPKLDLRLNLSTHHSGSSSEVAGGGAGNNGKRTNSPNSSSPSSSPPSSCLSSETEQGKYPSSPEATSMVLVGCPRCLMYVMLSEDDPRCPKCKSTVLLDFLKDPKNAVASTKKSRKN